MAPKRQKAATSKSPAKKAKTASKSTAEASEASDSNASGSHQKLVQSLLEDKLLGQTYCEELGIDITSGSNAMFQWLACSNMFGSRIGEVLTMRASRGLLANKLNTPEAISKAPLEEEVEALHSEGNIQRAPSMAHYLNQTAKAVLEDYNGNMDNLRKTAKRDPAKIHELVKKFKGFGEVAVNIFCREAQEAWEELFPFADDRTLKLAKEHGLPGTAKELAETVDNDKHQFVTLLAALIRADLRKVPVNDNKGTVDSGELADKQAEHEKEKKAHINTDKVQLQQGEAVDRYPQ